MTPLRALLVAACLFASWTSITCQLSPHYVAVGEPVPAVTIRIIALGTGDLLVVRNQVSTSYLVQLGTYRNVLLDTGTGSIVNLYSTGVDLSTIDTVFLSHLHSDHVTDLGPLYALNNQRRNPLRVYGPSGEEPATGTAALVAGLKQFLAWDQKARNHVSDLRPGTRGNQIEAHEFDYTVHDQLVYEDAASNFSVYSNPAFHYDTPGPVSLRLEWNGLSVTYSGDTIPLETFVQFAAGSDVVIHESVCPVVSFTQAPPVIQNILSNHTYQAEVGAVFEAIQPRLAIALHLSLNAYSYTPILSAIRSEFPTGPLALATDFDVWDVTPTSITQRHFLPVLEKAGYSFDQNPQEPSLATSDVATSTRPAVVRGNLTVLQLRSAAASPSASTAG